MAEETKAPERVDSIPNAARGILVDALRDQNIDPEIYAVEYYQDEQSYLVSVFYKLKPRGMRGSDPDHPDYEVTIQRDPLKLLQVSIAR